MDAGVYRSPETADPAVLLGAVGSWWGGSYEGRSLLGLVLAGRGRLEPQADDDFARLLSCLSRKTIPHTRHRRLWPLTLLESQRDNALVAFGSGRAFGDGLDWGTKSAGPWPSWSLPEGVVDVATVADAPKRQATLLVRGVDFDVSGDRILFRDDPFASGAFKVEELESGDRSLVVWLGDTQWQREDVYRQYGYVFGVPHAGGARYPDLVNAVYDAAASGSGRHQILSLFEAALDCPLAAGAETVENVFDDGRFRYVVTDAHVYRYSLDANALVAAGDVVAAGQSLTDGLLYHEFRGGTVPDWLPALALGPGLAGDGFVGSLVARNADLPTSVSEGEWTELRFELGGWPADVERFWSLAQARGVQAGRTLAMMLDARESPSGQPSAGQLPSALNPLAFLAANLLRSNAAVVKVRADCAGPDAAGLGSLLTALRPTVPPGSVLLVLFELSAVESWDRNNVEDDLELIPGQATSDFWHRGLATDLLTVTAVASRCI